MANREKHHRRVLRYFIEAAQSIIQKDGMEAVTIRKVAEIAGFNSATLYNYFQDLDQLLVYASLNRLTSYNQRITENCCTGKDWKEVLLLSWNEFSDISFTYPDEFSQIFFNKHSDSLPAICKSYYELFAEEEVDGTNEWYSILTDFNLSNRNKVILNKIYPNGTVSEKDLEIANELMISAYHLLLECRVSNKKEYSHAFCQQRMIQYVTYLLSTLKVQKGDSLNE